MSEEKQKSYSAVDVVEDYKSMLRSEFTKYRYKAAEHYKRCLRCENVSSISECKNCGGTEYQPGSSGDIIGIFCTQCDKGFTRWTCPKCGADNPIAKTLVKESLCFIATATMGTADVPEVVILRAFRDTCLLPSSMGQMFVRLYERSSPPLARAIARRPWLRQLARKLCVAPAARLAQLRMHKHSEQDRR